MKTLITFLLLFTLVSTSPIHAQVEGAATVNTSNLGKDNEWQNWIFAISAMVTAAVGVLVVSLNQGSPAPDTPH